MAIRKWQPLFLAASMCLAVAMSSPPAQGATAAPPPPWQTKEYHYGACQSTASQYLWAALTWNIISNDTGLRVTVMETGGTEEDMYLVQNKKADMGNYDGLLVKKTFGDKHDLRATFPFTPLVWQFVVAKDANIKSLKDLNGKKWNPGPAGGGSTNITMDMVTMFGIKPNYYPATLSDAAEAYVDRQIVGFSYRGTGGVPDSAIVEAGSARPLTFISLTDEEIGRIHERWPELNKIQVRANLYPGQTEPFNTFGSPAATGIAAHKDMPAEAVYAITKSYWKNFKTICKQYPSVCAATMEGVVNGSVIPLHVGAIKFYRENGLKIPDGAIPPEARK
jgi:TRAP transporter TAXI family solute receptor